jgi:ferredoxin--NADP+ reductase
MAIAIVGTGPAGFYTADMLSKALPDQQIHLFERLPLPYGLVRYGVAPDHPGTKSVAQLFERVMKRTNTRFFGNIAIGPDVDIGMLEAAYDVVVLATGASIGHQLACPGIEQAANVSGIELAGWFNGKPGLSLDMFPRQAKSVCIIGNGNVSLDAARLLAKPVEALRNHGVPENVIAWRKGLGLEEIHICGRRSAAETRFSVTELEELGELHDFCPVVSISDISDANGPNNNALAVLDRYSHLEKDVRRKIHFHFNQEFLSYQDESLRTRNLKKEMSKIPAQMFVHAIGQRGQALPGLPFDENTGRIPNVDGLVCGKDRTYVVGWAANVDGGQIAISRRNAQLLLSKILEKFSNEPRQASLRHESQLLQSLPTSTVSWSDVLSTDPWRKKMDV